MNSWRKLGLPATGNVLECSVCRDRATKVIVGEIYNSKIGQPSKLPWDRPRQAIVIQTQELQGLGVPEGCGYSS